MKSIRACVLVFVALLLPAVPGASVFAQTFPEKSVRLIVPGAPGSSTDVLARLIAQRLTDSWRQPVVIDNRAGAGGTVGAEAAARANADGYTVILVNAGFAVSAALYNKKLSYDSIRDFAPVGAVAAQPMILIVNPTLPVASVKEFVAYAKANSNQLTFGSSGNGSIAHLVAELFKWKVGVRTLHVPYKGVAPAVTALLSGEIQALFPGIVPALPHIRSGRLRALAVSTRNRAAVAPTVPTMAESGVPDYDESNWQGFLTPSGTPPSVISKINAEVVAAMQSPAIRKVLAASGTDARTGDPSSFGRFLITEITKWQKLVRDSGARID